LCVQSRYHFYDITHLTTTFSHTVMDVNSATLIGPVRDFKSKKISLQSSSFNACSFIIDACTGPLKIDVKSPSDKAVLFMKTDFTEYASNLCAIITHGELSSSWDKKRHQYWYKTTTTVSNLQLVKIDRSDTIDSYNQCVVTGSIVSVSEDGRIVMVDSKYRYFSKKKDKNIEASNFVTCQLTGTIGNDLVGRKILVRGMVHPKMLSKWQPNVKASYVGLI